VLALFGLRGGTSALPPNHEKVHRVKESNMEKVDILYQIRTFPHERMSSYISKETISFDGREIPLAEQSRLEESFAKAAWSVMPGVDGNMPIDVYVAVATHFFDGTERYHNFNPILVTFRHGRIMEEKHFSFFDFLQRLVLNLHRLDTTPSPF
jgi:hypothetical protein